MYSIRISPTGVCLNLAGGKLVHIYPRDSLIGVGDNGDGGPGMTSPWRRAQTSMTLMTPVILGENNYRSERSRRIYAVQ